MRGQKMQDDSRYCARQYAMWVFSLISESNFRATKQRVETMTTVTATLLSLQPRHRRVRCGGARPSHDCPLWAFPLLQTLCRFFAVHGQLLSAFPRAHICVNNYSTSSITILVDVIYYATYSVSVIR